MVMKIVFLSSQSHGRNNIDSNNKISMGKEKKLLTDVDLNLARET